MNTLEYSELHPSDSFIETQFFTSLRKLLEQCLYTEFSWRDLHVPTSKRLRTQLSAIINLVKYLEGEQIKIFNELNGPVRQNIYNIIESGFVAILEENLYSSHGLLTYLLSVLF